MISVLRPICRRSIPTRRRNALAHAFEPGGRAQRIDYIFFRPARGAVELHCKQLEIFFDKPLAPVDARRRQDRVGLRPLRPQRHLRIHRGWALALTVSGVLLAHRRSANAVFIAS